MSPDGSTQISSTYFNLLFMKLNQLKESTHGLYATEISQGDQLKLSKFKIYLF